jgi:hypothetical protein
MDVLIALLWWTFYSIHTYHHMLCTLNSYHLKLNTYLSFIFLYLNKDGGKSNEPSKMFLKTKNKIENMNIRVIDRNIPSLNCSHLNLRFTVVGKLVRGFWMGHTCSVRIFRQHKIITSVKYPCYIGLPHWGNKRKIWMHKSPKSV